MSSLILTIASICQIMSGDRSAHRVEYRQKECHKYYADCVKNESRNITKRLIICMSNRGEK
jgi:hypothetical protein